MSPHEGSFYAGNFQLEYAFTETYRRHLQVHVAIREAMCLREMYPTLFEDIREGDRFAGRIGYRTVGIGLEHASGGPGYYCSEVQIQQALQDENFSDEERRRVEEMMAFWKGEATIPVLKSILPVDVRKGTENEVASMEGRLSGAEINFDMLLQLGLPGLRAKVEEYKRLAAAQNRDVEMYDGWLMALDLLGDVCLDYARRARVQAARVDTKPSWKAELGTIAATLERIVVAKPDTLREAAQLAFLYALIAGVVNYGRMDVYLGDFYAKDIDNGRVTEDEALSYVQSIWKLIADREIVFNGRVIIGGRGRRNEENADRFALAAMEATRTVLETEPQLSLRFYRGQNPALMEKALSVIGEGRTYPMLYNDDVNVPAVQNAFDVPVGDAEHYLPYGCGEYALDSISFGSPNCSLNMLKALEIALHNGRDPKTGKQLGPKTGKLRDFHSFEDLFVAYQKQLEYFVEYLAKRHAIEYQVESKSAAFLYISMLFEHCIERGKSVVDRGTRYTGGVVETFGMVNTADSLTAIKKLVYETKTIRADELITVLDANFAGYEQIHRRLMSAPKFGNDDPEADKMVQAVSNHVSRFTRQQAQKVGLDYFLVVNINNFANVSLGKETGPSADGRKDGAPLANANTPTAGNDRKGVTAFMNSIASVDATCHAGYVQNMKFTRRMFREERPKVEALLNGYFQQGGTQAMITVVSKDDLENAMLEPEKYRNLIVRVGGFSARFVELSRDVQQDLIKRTLYD